jgi:hypothetical protein
LIDNYLFSDFELTFNPPFILSEQEFKALVNELINFGFMDYNGPIFINLVRDTPENKKIIKITYFKNINGGKMYKIININGKTYLDS